MHPMNHTIRNLWHWYTAERSGMLFPSLRGFRRFVIELPLILGIVFSGYSDASKMPLTLKTYTFSLLKSPFIVGSWLGILLYFVVLAYIRDQVFASGLSLRSRVSIFVPSTLLASYRRQLGDNVLVQFLLGFRVFVFMSFFLGTYLICQNLRPG